jgi:hypothetical protein
VSITQLSIEYNFEIYSALFILYNWNIKLKYEFIKFTYRPRPLLGRFLVYFA